MILILSKFELNSYSLPRHL